MFKKSIIALVVVTTMGSAIAASAGVVSIYDYRMGEKGDLLGKTDVTEGANTDVRVTLDAQQEGNLLAVLTNGDEVIGTEMVRVVDAK